MANVIFKNISKSFDRSKELWAVKDFTIDIADGELVVLVGPSGCGKSTTLRLLAGLDEATSGTIRIGGRDVTNLAPKDRDIAMVFQNYALYPQKSVYENLAFGLRVRGVDRSVIDTSVRSTAESLGLEKLLERKPNQLSGGQRQRVALGRALVREPQCFLLDEPLSNLDAKLRVKMREELSTLHNRIGATMVYVTHDQIEAMTLGDRIVIMNEGEVQQVGTPLTLYDRPANIFVATFIGSPEMNLLDGTLTKGNDGEFRVCCGDMRLELSPPNTVGRGINDEAKVVLGIRPEHIVREDSHQSIDMQVQLVEQIGAQTYVVGDVDNQKIRAVFERDDAVASGDKIPIILQRHKIHLFSCEEGGVRLNYLD